MVSSRRKFHTSQWSACYDPLDAVGETSHGKDDEEDETDTHVKVQRVWRLSMSLCSEGFLLHQEKEQLQALQSAGQAPN
jgi:hypothetical protein